MDRNNQVYCITDIETTGGKGPGHRVTEIAIIKFDGKKVIDTFTTLINPEKRIPYNIMAFTGITNEMVSTAPKFYEVAKKIVEFTKDTVFVAHNVFFDYNIIRREFSELGYTFSLPKLCTVRLARRHLPGYASYSLGKICKDLGIPIKNRHRALGDAEATVELFIKILEKNKNASEELSIEPSKKLVLPNGLSHKDIDTLPEKTGIYYLLDESGEILYVGKSKDIKKRVKSHFRSGIKREKELVLKSKIFSIDYEVLDNEWISLIVEASEIKKRRPAFNISLNRVKFPYHLTTTFTDGFLDIKVVTSKVEAKNSALSYKSRKVAERARDKIYSLTFGNPYDSQFLQIFQKNLGPKKFNDSLSKALRQRDYPSSDFSPTIELDGKKVIQLGFSDNTLKRIRWISIKNNTVLKEKIIDEDPDIKRLVLKKINAYSKKSASLKPAAF